MGPRRLGWNRLVAGVLVTIAMLASAQPASADWNAAPIAVPLLGSTGAGSPYPSRITLAPPGGPTRASPMQVTLHNVTPSAVPRILVVLLVHDGTGYLLMANAGGCRALQGTSITFTSSGGAALPDNPRRRPVTAPTMTIIAVGLWRRARRCRLAGAARARDTRPAGPRHRRPELGPVRDRPAGTQPRRRRRRLVAALRRPRCTVDAPETPFAIPPLGATGADRSST